MEDLVRGFAEGQMSRRVFIRRMVTAGATLSGATVFANLIQAHPAQASTLFEQVLDYSFNPSTLELGNPNDYVSWQWDVSASGHTVTDTSGLGLFDSSKIANPNGTPPPLWNWVTAFGFGFWAAGTYTYQCKDGTHPPMSGTIQAPIYLIPPKGHTAAMVQWGSKDLTADPVFPNLRYDVKVRKPGQSWKTWKKGVGNFSSKYGSTLSGRHSFRARVRDVTTDVAIGWSPTVRFRI